MTVALSDRSFVDVFWAEVRNHASFVSRADGWLSCHPSGTSIQRPHGWKLHLSAAPSTAAAVMAATAPVLSSAAVPFKVAADVATLRRLTAADVDRGRAGKFITVYPTDNVQLELLAQQLIDATSGLDGPRILGDVPLLGSSVVHARYGGFVEALEFSSDGELVSVLHGPAGERWLDTRPAAISFPDWAALPQIVAESLAAVGAAGTGARRLDGRLRVTAAFKHANKGGVFLAVDDSAGVTLVLKRGRRLVAEDGLGRDAAARTRHEAELLQALDGALVPRVLSVFDEGDSCFLALELIGGGTLRETLSLTNRLPVLHSDRFRAAIGAIEAVASCHERGCVVRDISPNNLLSDGGDGVRLIDVELAHLVDRTPSFPDAWSTPAYAARHIISGGPADFDTDRFALAATVVFALTGADPLFGRRVPSLTDRLLAYCDVVDRGESDGRLTALVRLFLERRGPVTTSDIGDARRLATPSATVVRGTVRAQPELDRRVRLARIAAAQLDHLVDQVERGAVARMLSVGARRRFDDIGIQYGSSGVGVALIDASGAVTGMSRTRLLDAAVQIAELSEAALRRGPARPPSLYFGTGGLGWLAAELADATGDQRWVDLAGAMLQRAIVALEATPPNPDICHGAAGVALLALRCRALPIADHALDRIVTRLLASAVERDGLTLWPIEARMGSRIATERGFVGYAHGAAGIAHVLLLAAVTAGREDCLDMTRRVVSTLERSAIETPMGLGWPQVPGGTLHPPYWCNGSAGIASFLVRAAAVLDDDATDVLAAGATAEVAAHRYLRSTPHCHGLAGSLHTIADAIAFGRAAPSPELLLAGADIADALTVRAASDVEVDGLIVDEDGTDVSLPYGTGLSGITHALLRWLGPDRGRAFHLDPVLALHAGGATATLLRTGAHT